MGWFDAIGTTDDITCALERSKVARDEHRCGEAEIWIVNVALLYDVNMYITDICTKLVTWPQSSYNALHSINLVRHDAFSVCLHDLHPISDLGRTLAPP